MCDNFVCLVALVCFICFFFIWCIWFVCFIDKWAIRLDHYISVADKLAASQCVTVKRDNDLQMDQIYLWKSNHRSI